LMGLLAAYSALARSVGLPGAAFVAWADLWMWAVPIGIIFCPLLALFPDGRLPSRRWRWVLWCGAGYFACAVAGNAFRPGPMPGSGVRNPLGIEGATGLMDGALALAVVTGLGAMLGGLAALTVRFRRGGPVERQQLKWFLCAAALLPVAVVVGEWREQQLFPIVAPIAFGLFPVAAGMAVLRYRLYDIDRIVSRTLSYAVVTALLGGMYVAGVFLLTPAVAGIGGGSQVAVAASTLGVAVAFGPVRRRVQGVVDRRFNRARYDAERTIAGFAGRLRDEVDLDQLTTELMGVVSRSIEPAAASLWLRQEAPR
jgi:hypothetical protein